MKSTAQSTEFSDAAVVTGRSGLSTDDEDLFQSNVWQNEGQKFESNNTLSTP